METARKSLTEAEKTRRISVNTLVMRWPGGDAAAPQRGSIMSARLEDLKFMLTLSAVVLFGSGLDIILR
jgi:hypothetical protein